MSATHLWWVSWCVSSYIHYLWRNHGIYFFRCMKFCPDSEYQVLILIPGYVAGYRFATDNSRLITVNCPRHLSQINIMVMPTWQQMGSHPLLMPFYCCTDALQSCFEVLADLVPMFEATISQGTKFTAQRYNNFGHCFPQSDCNTAHFM